MCTLHLLTDSGLNSRTDSFPSQRICAILETWLPGCNTDRELRQWTVILLSTNEFECPNESNVKSETQTDYRELEGHLNWFVDWQQRQRCPCLVRCSRGAGNQRCFPNWGKRKYEIDPPGLACVLKRIATLVNKTGRMPDSMHTLDGKFIVLASACNISWVLIQFKIVQALVDATFVILEVALNFRGS